MKSPERPSSIAAMSAVVLAAAIVATPSDAGATVPCDTSGPCHNNFAEPIVMYVLGAEAFGFGLIGTVGNAATLARNSRAGTGWLTFGYIGVAYNLALGAAWTSLSGSSLATFPDDSYARMQLGMGIAHLAVGTITLGVTAAAHKRRVEKSYSMLPVLPSFAPAPGGGTLMLTGHF